MPPCCHAAICRFATLLLRRLRHHAAAAAAAATPRFCLRYADADAAMTAASATPFSPAPAASAYAVCRFALRYVTMS